MPMLSGRIARMTATVALVAAAIAALPSLEWCPLRAWTAIACEVRAEVDASCAAANGCATETPSAPEASPADAPASCASLPTPFCDPEPDPLPLGDRLWCIHPPVIALSAKADPLNNPAPTPARLVSPPVLAPPALVTLARAAALPRPPILRGAHAPPQPRAPPGA